MDEQRNFPEERDPRWYGGGERGYTESDWEPQGGPGDERYRDEGYRVPSPRPAATGEGRYAALADAGTDRFGATDPYGGDSREPYGADSRGVRDPRSSHGGEQAPQPAARAGDPARPPDHHAGRPTEPGRLGDPGRPPLDPGRPPLDPGRPPLDPGRPPLDPGRPAVEQNRPVPENGYPLTHPVVETPGRPDNTYPIEATHPINTPTGRMAAVDPRSGEGMGMPASEATQFHTEPIDRAALRRPAAPAAPVGDGIYRTRRPAVAILFAILAVVFEVPALRLLLDAVVSSPVEPAGLISGTFLVMGLPLFAIGLYALSTGAARIGDGRAWLRGPTAYLTVGLVLFLTAAIATA